MGVFGLADEESHLAAASAFFFIEVGDFSDAGERVADEDGLEELKLLLAMEDPAQVEAAEAGARSLVGPECARLQKGDRYGDSADFFLGDFLIEIDWIGIFDRAGELANLAPIDMHLERLAGFTDDTFVGHVNCLSR